MNNFKTDGPFTIVEKLFFPYKHFCFVNEEVRAHYPILQKRYIYIPGVVRFFSSMLTRVLLTAASTTGEAGVSYVICHAAQSNISQSGARIHLNTRYYLSREPIKYWVYCSPGICPSIKSVKFAIKMVITLPFFGTNLWYTFTQMLNEKKFYF